jgi:hypothetical protein
MDKSNTVNKQIIEQAIIEAVKHIRYWTKKELSNLLVQHRFSKDNILIIPVGTSCFLVGNYAIRKHNNEWHMIYRYNDNELKFQSRNAALFYSICMQTNRQQLADLIYTQDQHVNRLSIETDRYQIRLKHLSRNKNLDLRQLYTSRHDDSKLKLKHARFLLEKSLTIAKY